jgi:hypothetical protein
MATDVSSGGGIRFVALLLLEIKKVLRLSAVILGYFHVVLAQII